MSRSFELPVIPLAGAAANAGRLLSLAAAWYCRISQDRCGITYHWMPSANTPRPLSWYAAVSGGKGAWPRNSQSLVTDIVAKELRSNQRLILLTGPDLLAHAWRVPRGFGDSRYVILPSGSTLGTVVHEFGHLLFDWPDWTWPAGHENDCLMARGALMEKGAEPASPCAPLLLREGWNVSIPLGRTTLVRELIPGTTGVIDWPGNQILVEKRDRPESRLVLYKHLSEAFDQPPLTRVVLTPKDEERAVLGLLGPVLRRYKF